MDRISNAVKRDKNPDREGTFGLRQKAKGVFKKDDASARANHVSRPLSSLQDPSSFGPPPTRTAGAILPPPGPPGTHRSYPTATTQPSSLVDSEQPPVSRPYRADTTGLSTAHLPAPPVRRAGAAGPSPPPYSPGTKPAPPSLPPRLPPRGAAPPPPPARTSVAEPSSPTSPYLNQGASSRLSAAGISVSGLGIGNRSPPANELPSRFGKLGLGGASPSPPAPTPSQGTTFAQKQAALQTAASFRQDPSSVSATDARAAASTLNNFRQRHGEQVAAGARSASSFNQKYGVSERIGKHGGEAGEGGGGAGSSLASAAGLLGKKKPPPPPPQKRNSAHTEVDAPPPIPASSRPQF